VRDRITIDHVAGFELAVRDGSISSMVAEFSTGDNVDHVRGMRVSLLLIAGFDRSFENTDARIFQFQRNGLCIYSEWVLFTCYTRVAANKSSDKQNKYHNVDSLHLHLLLMM